MTSGIPHPFEIFWDVDSASYYIFVPDGCVLVNGVAATNDDVDNGNLALDFGDTPPEKVYCHVKQEEDEESGEKSWKFTIDGEEEDEDAKWNVLVATFGKEENDGQSYDVVCSAISLGGSGEIVGDYDGSEAIRGDEEPILVTGHPGEEDEQGHDSHSGLQFLTVGARTDEESGKKIPPKIVARIIDKPEDEDWAARTMTVTSKDGSAKKIHFLGSKDIEIDGGGGGSFDDNKSSKVGRYAIVSIEGGVVTMKNPYFSVGGITYEGSSTEATLTGGSTDVIALRVSATGESAPTDAIEVYESFAALQAAQQALDYYTIPIFMVSTTLDEETGDEAYGVVCDFRTGPDAAMGEF